MSDDSNCSIHLPHCEWRGGELGLVGLEDIAKPIACHPIEVKVARLQLTSPSVVGGNPDLQTSHLIRAPLLKRDKVTTLMRSLDNGSPRIVLTPAMTLNECGAIVFNLTIACETKDADAEKEFQRFWSAVVERLAMPFTRQLGVAIEDELFGSDVSQH